MKRSIRTLAPALLLGFALGLSQAAGAQPAALPEPPKLRLPGNVSPLRYAAELTLVPAQEKFTGAIAIDLEIKEPTALLWLNASDLTIGSATLTVNGERSAARVVPGGEDFVGFAFDRQVGKGTAQLRVEYTGVVSAVEADGLFRQQEGGDWYLFSQFEATDARRAFPCFDEPSYKVPWSLTLHVKREHAAVSNTPVVSESDEPDGMKKVTFAPTQPLPSYLVALGVGPFDFLDAGRAGKNRTPIRIVTPRGRAKEAWYAAESSGAVLELLESYLGSPYPYEKLDQLTIPQFGGAMENAGLITYDSRLMLVKPENASIGFKRTYVHVLAHEAVHQWFGDLVTLAWWDDTWLNESFASWLGDKITDRSKPDWGGDVDRAVERSAAAAGDTLIAARQIRQPIESKHDISNAFDGITYGKGQAVLQMFEAYMGEESFQRGVQRYLREHAYGNAKAADFIGALTAIGGAQIGPAFSSFLDQPGIPLVTIDLRCNAEGPKLLLSQKRFLPLGSQGSTKQLWSVPVCVRRGPEGAAERVCTLLTQETAELPLRGACPEWVLGNAGGLGYYRTALRGDLLGKLLGQGAKMLTVPERVGALADAAALVETGELSMKDALGLVPVFADDPDRHIVESTLSIAQKIRDHLVPERLRPQYARFLQKTFGVRARALGLAPKPGESEETKLLRQSLVRFVAENSDDQVLLGEATALARKWVADRKSISPETAETVLRLAASHGDPALFELFHEAAKKTEDRRERGMLLSALGAFPQPALAAQAQALLLTDEFDTREALALFAYHHSELAIQMDYDFIKKKGEALAAKLPRDVPAYFPLFASGFCDEGHRADVESFFKDSIAKYTGGPRNLAKVLEGIRLCSALKSAQQAGVEQFLQAY
jgi:aminopeptidase N